VEETLVYFGSAIKDLGEGRVGGYLVRFSDHLSPDLEGDFFTKDTYFDVEEGDRVSVYYQHGLDSTLKNKRIGRGELKIDDVGLWIEAQLDLHDEYVRMLYERGIQDGKMGWSSGAVGHLVERESVGKARWIKSWPIGEGSITPTPAEPRNVVLPLKSLKMATVVEGPEARPETLEGVDRAADTTTDAKADIHIISEEDNMPDNDTKAPPADNDRLDALEAKMQDLGRNLDRILEYMESAPPIKNAGYFTQDGGAADQNVKSFGDFLLAVQRGDVKRLREVYGSAKTLVEDAGGAGGYLVPDQYVQDLLRVAKDASPIVNMVQRVPVGSDAGMYPALDQYVAPTPGVGDTAYAAGVTAVATAENSAYTDTDPAFEQIRWRIHKIGGVTRVTEELMSDSPMAIEALLRGLFGIAIAAKEEYFILRGSGVGEPLGILNADAAIPVAPIDDGVFSYGDMLAMKARFKAVGGQPAWFIHQGVWPDIGMFEVGTNGAGVPSGVGTDAQYDIMPGTRWPIITSEHLPQDDNSGCVLLADMNAYKLFVKGGLSVSYSEHADFTNGRVVWRFHERLDGQPWLKNVITLADPQGGYTVSPFVYFND